MKRINAVFLLGFFLALASLRTIPDGDYRLFGVIAVLIGFGLWMAIGYVYAWMVVLRRD